ncbi:zinc-finger homeodomain protein 6-like [Papaver somniferum]|nr:zinc-finger homeodomain protein 6-like [Papaver somniferum]
MEFRGTDKRSMPSSSSSAYNNNPSIIRDQLPSFSATTTLLSPTSGRGGGERRSNNGSTSAHHLYQNQVLDQHQHRQRVPVDNQPDPDPVSIAGIDTPPVASPIAIDGSTTESLTTIRYRECLKNHAANIGGHVVDGCGEFMPSGEEGTREALKCAACDCHRNFHRKQVDGESLGANCYYCYNPGNKNDRGSRSVPPRSHSHHPLTTPTTTFLPTQLQQHQSKFHQLGLPNSPPSGPIQPMMMAFGGGGGAESSSEEHNMFGGIGQSSHPGSSKKRFRTKFTQEQKDKLLEFAEKIGWRIQKQDEQEVQQFCAEVGVKRQVFKVWMHNNKHVMRKKEL